MLADAQGNVHVGVVHYAHKRVARGAKTRLHVPAWLRIPGKTPHELAQRELAKVLADSITAAAKTTAALLNDMVPEIAAGHATLRSSIAGLEPINDTSHTEVFGSVDNVACPHDGLRDDQYGYAVTLFCLTADPPPHAQVHDLRSMVLLLGKRRIRIPFVRKRGIIWRPHMQPHFCAAPAFSDAQRTYHDVLYACQVGGATADLYIKAQGHVPCMIEEERALRAMQKSETLPWVPTNHQHTALVYSSLGQPLESSE